MTTKTMNIITWVLQVILSILLIIPAAMKMFIPYQELLTKQAWVEDFAPYQVMIIGILELLGIIGLNLPFLLKKFKKIVPVAALGLAMTMIGAVITHIGRSENFVPPMMIFFLASFVAYKRKDLLFDSKKIVN